MPLPFTIHFQKSKPAKRSPTFFILIRAALVLSVNTATGVSKAVCSFLFCVLCFTSTFTYTVKKREKKKPKESSSLIHRKNMKNSLFFHQVHIHIYHI